MDAQQTKAHVCLCCNKLLTGRADKKFCDSACKSRYSRTTPLTANPLTVSVVSSPIKTTVSLPPLSASPEILAKHLLFYEPWWVLEGPYGRVIKEYSERYDIVRRHQEKNDSYHALYADIAELFLCGDYNQYGEENYPDILNKVAQAINTYSEHPGRYIPGNASYFRLANLYLMYFHLQALQKIAPISHKYPGPIHIEQCFSKKHTQSLWEDLLGFKEYREGAYKDDLEWEAANSDASW